MTSFDMVKFWGLDFLRAKGKAFSYNLDERIEESVVYVESKYEDFNKFKELTSFIDLLLDEWVKGDMRSLSRLGFYSMIEVRMELDNAIKHSLMWSYKAAISDMRRAIEMMVMQIYFSLEITPKNESKEWLKSEMSSPMMKKMLNSIVSRSEDFSDFNEKFKLIDEINDLYWTLSDYSHNKGTITGYSQLNEMNIHLSSTYLTTIKLETLRKCIDLYVRTTEEIVILLALYNPILLVGLPLDEKFWLNWPISWFFNEWQSEYFHSLIPDRYKLYFRRFSEENQNILGLAKTIESMPSLTEEDFALQVEAMNNQFNEHRW